MKINWKIRFWPTKKFICFHQWDNTVMNIFTSHWKKPRPVFLFRYPHMFGSFSVVVGWLVVVWFGFFSCFVGVFWCFYGAFLLIWGFLTFFFLVSVFNCLTQLGLQPPIPPTRSAEKLLQHLLGLSISTHLLLAGCPEGLPDPLWKATRSTNKAVTYAASIGVRKGRVFVHLLSLCMQVWNHLFPIPATRHLWIQDASPSSNRLYPHRRSTHNVDYPAISAYCIELLSPRICCA